MAPLFLLEALLLVVAPDEGPLVVDELLPVIVVAIVVFLVITSIHVG